MDHLRKAILEQIAILSDHKCNGMEISLHFVRDHALSIVQMTEEALLSGRRHDSKAEKSINA
jgi:hypothetical protein